jgi:DNA mismatch repair ATPase MutS
MISTHDLELARADRLKEASRAVHFRETISGQNGDEQMAFDYILRPGVSPTTNALKLLKFVGLGDSKRKQKKRCDHELRSRNAA